jgi:hypothetical protein
MAVAAVVAAAGSGGRGQRRRWRRRQTRSAENWPADRVRMARAAPTKP